MSYYHRNFSPRPQKKRVTKRIVVLIVILIIVAGGVAKIAYDAVFKPNVWVSEGITTIQLKTGISYEEFLNQLYKQGLLINRNSFELWANYKKLPTLFKTGNYTIKDKWNNNELINLFRAGNQTPVKVVVNKERTIEGMAGRLGKQLEADSIAFITLLTDSSFLSELGINSTTALSLFIPNTYEFYWNSPAKPVLERLNRESTKFWNKKRSAQLEEIGLSKNEALTLASIIEEETNKNDEKARMAGVYVNRLKRNWKLQADPTLKYALGDFSIKRVLNEHKTIDSPYNTYMYNGLPPGPICVPSISSIDAVLNYEEHSYLYFCAKTDFSGYHTFATTNAEHNRNARKYRQALNKRKIYK